MEVSGKTAGNDDNLATLDTLCELCEEDNVNTPANGFCKECEQCMCNACFRQHTRATLCRYHTLLDPSASSEKCARRNDSTVKCKQHEADTIKYYCRTHEVVGCGDCIVSKHGGCKPEFIKDLSYNFLQNEEYKTFMNTLEKLICERKEFEKKIQENRKENEMMLEKALQDIKQFRLDINKYLDKVEKDITCQIRNVMEENDILLKKLENDCTMLSTKFVEITDMLNRELYKDNVLFIHVVECKPKLPESEKAFSDMKSKSMKMYEFVCDQQLRSLVTSSQKLGTLAISTSAIFPPTTDRVIEKSISQGYAKAIDEHGHRRKETWKEHVEGRYKNETTERKNDQTSKKTEYGVGSLVASADGVKISERQSQGQREAWIPAGPKHPQFEGELPHTGMDGIPPFTDHLPPQQAGTKPKMKRLDDDEMLLQKPLEKTEGISLGRVRKSQRLGRVRKSQRQRREEEEKTIEMRRKKAAQENIKPLYILTKRKDENRSKTNGDGGENVSDVETRSIVTSEGESDTGPKSLVAVGARVKHNNPITAIMLGEGTVTEEYGYGTVTVKWRNGESALERIGDGPNDVALT